MDLESGTGALISTLFGKTTDKLENLYLWFWGGSQEHCGG
jgi:hypothetical protein